MSCNHVHLSRLISSGIKSPDFSIESDIITTSYHFDKPEKRNYANESCDRRQRKRQRTHIGDDTVGNNESSLVVSSIPRCRLQQADLNSLYLLVYI